MRKKIVLIDDDRIFHTVFKIVLVQLDDAKEFELYSFFNAFDAVDYLRSTDVLPSYIFVDINMPVMNGWGFLAQYKKIVPHNSDSKVIMISGSSYEYDRDNSMKYAFVDGFIAKPINPSILEGVLYEGLKEIAI